MPSVSGIEKNRNALPGVTNDCCVVDALFGDGFDPDSIFCSSTILLLFSTLWLGYLFDDFCCQHPIINPSAPNAIDCLSVMSITVKRWHLALCLWPWPLLSFGLCFVHQPDICVYMD